MILGITGAMRRQEQHELEIQKVQDKGSFYLIYPRQKMARLENSLQMCHLPT